MKRVAVAAVLAGGIALAWLLVRSGDPPPRQAGAPGARASADAIVPARAPKVRRPAATAPAASAVARPRDLAELRATARELDDPEPEFVPDPVFEKQAKANHKCVQEARASGDHPERLDPRILPPPFDKGVWKRDPQAYLDVVEPGRVWQAADDSSGADPLRAEGPTEVTVARGGKVKLGVRTEGKAPVTFTSLDGGALDNGLASFTVGAKGDGFAGATFTATQDLPEIVTVVAASPYATGVVTFTVQISGR